MIPMTFSYILTVSLFFFLLFLKYSPSHSVIKIPTPLFSKITCTLLFLSVAALLSHGPFLLSWLLELLCYIFTSEGLSLGNFARVRTCNVCLSQSGLFHSFWFFFPNLFRCTFHDFSFLYSWILFPSVCVYVLHLHIHLSIEECFCYHVLSGMNRVAVMMGDQVFLEWDVESFGHMPRRHRAGSDDGAFWSF